MSVLAVVMAGGKGTRIASVNSTLPKPMIPLLGKPVLQYTIEALSREGVKDFVFVIGYLGEKIQDYFGDGHDFGVNISYIVEKEPLGTAGALYYLKGKVDEDFLLVNGDIVFDINVQRLMYNHRKNKSLATIVTHPNGHPHDSGVIFADKNGVVTKWLNREDERVWYRNRVNAGIHVISPKLLDEFTEAKKTDLDRDVLRPLIAKGELSCYDTPEYIKDMGTPERYKEVENDLRLHRPELRNLSHKQKAIFLDRDGTINKYVGFLTNIDDFELLPGVVEAIRKINESDYLAIVVTNQPQIARGELTFEELDEIHAKMETLLGKEGVYLDGLYFCPHHPDRGFPGERPELKVDCPCRKPKPGMLLKASAAYNIALGESWIVGDTALDIETGINGGLRTAILGKDERADMEAKDLLEAVNRILKKEE